MITEATRESGNVVGNSLKSILARITTNSSATNALEAIGISLEKASGESKNAEELISELAGQWDNLSDAQRRNTAVGVGGIYQLSR